VPRDLLFASAAGAATTSTASMARRQRSGMRTDGTVTLT
jgi:hypothetical protein